jgi:AcrR family transcriptional regulator
MYKHDENLTIYNTSSPTRADARRNHRLVLETAARLFAEHGVEDVSMTQIAQEAGVGKGTLYRNFANKLALCYALLDQEQRDLQEATLRRLRQHPNTPQDNLQWFLKQAVLFVLRNEDLLHAGVEDDQAVALNVSAHLWWRKTISNLLSQMQLERDISYISDVLYVMLHVSTIRFQRHALDYSSEQIINGLLESARLLTT